MSRGWLAAPAAVERIESALSMRALQSVIPAILRGTGSTPGPELTIRIENDRVSAGITVSGAVPERNPLEFVQRFVV